MRRKNLSIRAQTNSLPATPPDYQKKIKNFYKFVESKIKEHSIGPDEIINMDEVPLTFDLPLASMINKTGASFVLLKTTGHKRAHFTCVLACAASGEKLPPMVTF